jgi:hypothetical protein
MSKYHGMIAACALAALAAGSASAQTTSGSGTSPMPSPGVQRDTPGGSSAPSEGRMPGAVQPGVRQDDRATGPSRSDSDVSNRAGSDIKGHGTSGTTGSTSGSTGSMSGSTGTMSGASGSGNADQVRKVQEALKAQGHDPGTIDGTMGAQTQEALRAFQKSKDLPVTGQLDSETIDKLGVGQAQSR